MFYILQNNNPIISDFSNDLLIYELEIKELENETVKTFNQSKYENQNGQLADISDTQEYKDKIAQEQKEIQKAELQSQIDELDKKRIRAVCEMEIKDEASGQTWLEFYTEQIHGLRRQIISL
jgi:hypothetical protein